MLAAVATYVGAMIPLFEGPLFDAAVAARAAASSPRPPEAERVAVIAVDAQSLASAALAPYPRTMFGPIWAQAIEAAIGAEAKAIAFDFLFSYSANALAESFPDLKGYDRPFLKALLRNRDRVVLGRAETVVPVRPYHAALRFSAEALGLLNVEAEPDQVYRTQRTAFAGADGPLQTLAAAAALRAGHETVPGEVVIAPRRHPDVRSRRAAPMRTRRPCRPRRGLPRPRRLRRQHAPR